MSLHENRWVCDCHLLELHRWLLNSTAVPQSVEPRCHSPHRLSGSEITATPEAEFACVPEVSPTTMYLEGAYDINVDSKCNNGWARNFCMSGTWTTDDGVTGTWSSFASKNNAAANAVFQVYRLEAEIDGTTSTVFLGQSNTTDADPINGTITATWPDPDVEGCWADTGTPNILGVCDPGGVAPEEETDTGPGQGRGYDRGFSTRLAGHPG